MKKLISYKGRSLWKGLFIQNIFGYIKKKNMSLSCINLRNKKVNELYVYDGRTYKKKSFGLKKFKRQKVGQFIITRLKPRHIKKEKIKKKSK